jgi:hypothetical protein
MLEKLLRVFLLPGDLVGWAVGAEAEDRATMSLIMNMLFWNAFFVLGTLFVAAS